MPSLLSFCFGSIQSGTLAGDEDAAMCPLAIAAGTELYAPLSELPDHPVCITLANTF